MRSPATALGRFGRLDRFTKMQCARSRFTCVLLQRFIAFVESFGYAGRSTSAVRSCRLVAPSTQLLPDLGQGFCRLRRNVSASPFGTIVGRENLLKVRRSGCTIKRDHTRPAKAEAMLQADAGAMDVSLLRAAAQLMRQFETLRLAGSPERVPL